jgi:hypothetical protein
LSTIIPLASGLHSENKLAIDEPKFRLTQDAIAEARRSKDPAAIVPVAQRAVEEFDVSRQQGPTGPRWTRIARTASRLAWSPRITLRQIAAHDAHQEEHLRQHRKEGDRRKARMPDGHGKTLRAPPSWKVF